MEFDFLPIALDVNSSDRKLNKFIGTYLEDLKY